MNKSAIGRPVLRALGCLVKQLAELQGDIAEVGVYLGGSARVFAQAAPHKTIHLFDTFEGISDEALTPKKDLDRLRGMFSSSATVNVFEEAKANLKDCPNVVFYKGLFPVTTEGLEDKQYCFLHLDCDTYGGHKSGLEYFWPKLVVGGAVVMNDYGHAHCVGATQAVDEFCKANGLVVHPSACGSILRKVG